MGWDPGQGVHDTDDHFNRTNGNHGRQIRPSVLELGDHRKPPRIHFPSGDPKDQLQASHGDLASGLPLAGHQSGLNRIEYRKHNRFELVELGDQGIDHLTPHSREVEERAGCCGDSDDHQPDRGNHGGDQSDDHAEHRGNRSTDRSQAGHGHRGDGRSSTECKEASQQASSDRRPFGDRDDQLLVLADELTDARDHTDNLFADYGQQRCEGRTDSGLQSTDHSEQSIEHIAKLSGSGCILAGHGLPKVGCILLELANPFTPLGEHGDQVRTGFAKVLHGRSTFQRWILDQ